MFVVVEFVGKADDEEALVLTEFLFEAVNQGAAFAVKGLQSHLYLLQLLLLLEVLVLLRGRKVVFEFIPRDAEDGFVVFLYLFPGLKLPPG